MSRGALALISAICLGATGASAHHSLSDYDSSRQITVDGRVAQFQFVNPHPFVILEVTDHTGVAQQWRLEMDNRYELADIGMNKDTLKAGDRLIIRGNPGHSQPRILYIRKLDRPADGYGFEQIGNRPERRTGGLVLLPTVPRPPEPH